MKQTVIAFSLLLLSACAAVPNAKQDMANIALPQAWQQGETKTADALPALWWEAFGDPKLNEFENKALAQNVSIQQAAFALQQSLLQLNLSTADLLPSLSASAGARASKALESGASTSKSFSSNAGISWQIDLFGKLLKARDVSRWSAKATAEDRQKVALATTTQVAELYWQLGSLNKKIALAEQNLSATEKLTDIVRSKYKHGAASEMDLLSAERSLRQQQSSMAALRHQHNQTHNALAVLVGEMPESDFAEPKDLPQPFRLPELAVNVPSEVLDNRPDIRATRDRLMADMATVDLRVRDFFPTFGLNLGVSAGGNQLSKIVADPVGSAALNVALPFLNFPDNVLNLKVSQVKYQSDLAAYKNTLYTALSEVENSLSQYNQLNQQHTLLKQNLETTRRLEKMRQVRYNNGADDLQKLLDAQSDTRQAEQAVVENELALYQNFLTRYVALGGKNILPDKI